MFECTEITAAIEADRADPRVRDDYVRCLPGDGTRGSVLLLGVVHDHPASVYRVAHLLTSIEADVLALELPPLAIPLFRLYADVDRRPPRLGGEMSAAIQANDPPRVSGIDAPNREYLRGLARRILAEDHPVPVVRSVLSDLVSGVAHAVACRLGAVVGEFTPLRPVVYAPITYDCSVYDTPADQAAHEAAHLAQRQSFLGAIVTPAKTRLVDTVREDAMAARIDGLRTAGDVVAVVGMEHLDPLASRLATPGST